MNATDEFNPHRNRRSPVRALLCLFLIAFLLMGFFLVRSAILSTNEPLSLEYPISKAPESSSSTVVFNLPPLPRPARFARRLDAHTRVEIQPVFDREFTREKFQAGGFHGFILPEIKNIPPQPIRVSFLRPPVWPFMTKISVSFTDETRIGPILLYSKKQFHTWKSERQEPRPPETPEAQTTDRLYSLAHFFSEITFADVNPSKDHKNQLLLYRFATAEPTLSTNLAFRTFLRDELRDPAWRMVLDETFFFLDAWQKPLLIQTDSTKEHIRLWSCGKNQVNENGAGDDLLVRFPDWLVPK